MKDNAEKPKNVIWIFGDQHRAQTLSINGDSNVHTPNMDNLAMSGVNFTNAVSGFPLCCPARGSILTSRYPHKCVPGHEHPLPEDQPTIANVFNDAGYHTAYFGKWHLDGFNERDGRAAMHIVPPERRGGYFNTVQAEKLRETVEKSTPSNQHVRWIFGHHHVNQLTAYTNLGERNKGYLLPAMIIEEKGYFTEIIIDSCGPRFIQHELAY